MQDCSGVVLQEVVIEKILCLKRPLLLWQQLPGCNSDGIDIAPADGGD